MPAKTLMIQGTASHVGKSTVVAALCRYFKNKGLRVAPFKAQNMSNNSFALASGGEIGRAQAAQAKACGIEPSVHMNPVLLKPSTDQKSQVVILGKVEGNLDATDYHSYKKKLFPIVLDSLHHLMNQYDLVLIEGAGSAAEINLKEGDIVNMAIAKSIASPVLLTGDIDKGGIFAQLIGTYELLDKEEKDLVKGFLINKFRGDKKILEPGLRIIEERTSKKVLGVLPYLTGGLPEEEDSVALEELGTVPKGTVPNSSELLIHVVRFPRISNFTDFEPLASEQGVRVVYKERPNRWEVPDLLILPGTKSTFSDLEFLKNSGFVEEIKRYMKIGVPILGICGGYQMLGEKLLDPHQVESDLRERDGLGLIPSTTVFEKNKRVAQVKGVHLESSLSFEGYEIHMGCTQGRTGSKPLFKISERYGMPIEDFDGISFEDNNGSSSTIWGTYIHGLFNSNSFRKYFINSLRIKSGLEPISNENRARSVPDPMDFLANMMKENIDMSYLEKIVGI